MIKHADAIALGRAKLHLIEVACITNGQRRVRRMIEFVEGVEMPDDTADTTAAPPMNCCSIALTIGRHSGTT